MDKKFDKLCRLCGSCITLGYNIFAKCDGINFSDLIRKYVCIDVSEEDILPHNICDVCRTTIKSFDDFALRCGRTQEELFNTICKDFNLAQQTEAVADTIKIEISDENKVKIEDVGFIELHNEDHYDDGFNVDFEDPNIKVLRLRNNRKIVKLPKPKKAKKKLMEEDVKDRDYNPHEVSSSNKSNKIKRCKGRPLKHDYSIVKYLCHICNTECLDWNSLKEHTLSLHNSRPQIKCICDQVVVTFINLRKHFNTHFNKKKNSMSCTQCDSMFVTNHQRDSHMRLVHADVNFMYACNSCDEKFTKKCLLRKHEESHLPKEITHIYRCDACDSSFRNLHTMENHKQTVHNDKRDKFICDMCSKEYCTKSSLTYHIRFVHFNERKLQCPKCQKRFVSNTHLNRHMDGHKDVKYRCTLCSLVLNSKATLKAHHVVHEEIYRYKCRYCEKQYKRGNDRKHHENRHLGITPYECPWCDKKFVDNSHLRNHKKTQHPKELEEYEAIHGPPSTRLCLKKVEEIDPQNIIPMIVTRSVRYGTSLS